MVASPFALPSMREDGPSNLITIPPSTTTSSTDQNQHRTRRRSERDQFSLALDPSTNASTSPSSNVSATTPSSSSNGKSRRPSSVFEHVGGILDRFGRRSHSKSEARDSSKRPSSSSVISLTGTGTAASDSSEAVSLEDELSPGGSNASHSVSHSRPPFWERSASSGSLGIEREGGSIGNHSGGVTNNTVRARTSPSLESDKVHQKVSLLASPPVMHRTPSVGSTAEASTDESTLTRSSAHQHTLNSPPPPTTAPSRRLSVIDRVLIQVTEDNERFSVVDISGLNSAAAVKERMLSKLHLFDEDPSCFALSRTEIGAVGSTGPRLDDDELLAMCWQMGDDKGSLKFLLHQIAAPSATGRAILPPPQSHHFSPRIVMHDLGEGSSATNTATTPTSFSRQGYSKPTSVSSRSSVGDQSQHQGEGSTGAESGAEGGASRLTRAKGNSHGRRSVAASSSLVDDVRNFTLDEREGQSYSSSDQYHQDSSPIEEISDALDVHTGRSDAARRVAQRSTGGQARHSIHGQWESEAGTSTSSSALRMGNAASQISPKTTMSDLSRPSSQRTASHPPPLSTSFISPTGGDAASPGSASSTLPRSLLAGGGRDRATQSSINADASRMYSNGGEYDYSDRNDDVHRWAKPPVSSSTNDNGRSFPDPMLRSQSANPYGQRPSTSDARVEGRSFATNNAAPVQHLPQIMSPASMTSPISPLSRPFDRERSSSFGGGPPYPSQSMHQASMQDLRAGARPTHHPSAPMLRPIVHPQQGSSLSTHGPPPGYSSSSANRPAPAGHAHYADRRYMGPPPLPHSAGRPPPMQEFGARGSLYDPRVNFSAPRPSLSMSDRSRFPQGTPNSGFHQFQPQAHVVHGRDDPRFPASSPRMVSEFQRTASSTQSMLQPGMTVQESMQHHRSPVPQNRPTLPPNQFRPPQPFPQPQAQLPRNMRSESMTGSMPMMHASSMSAAYGRDSRQQQHQQRPSVPWSYDSRADAQTFNASGGGAEQIPASMRYYYNPATPTAAQKAVSQAQSPQLQGSSTSITPQQASAQLVKAAERSSGSSFNTNDSSTHTRVPSSSDKSRLEGEHSAPTSARSSRTSRSMSPKAGERDGGAGEGSELPYTADTSVNAAMKEGDLLSDEDLRNIRPLPHLPGNNAAFLPAPIAGEDEDTFRAGQWKQIMNNLEAEGEGTARAQPRHSNQPLAALPGIHADNAIEGAELDESSGTFKTFDDDDDDDDDQGGTWAQPLDSAIASKISSVGHARAALQAPSTSLGWEGTLMPGNASDVSGSSGPSARSQSPRRPILTLDIDPGKVALPKLIDDSVAVDASPKSTQMSESATQPSPSPGSSTAALARRSSFARRERGEWAFRPPPEQLYENLDDFFSKHDLDKPVLDPATGLAPTSPQAASPRVTNVQSIAALSSTTPSHSPLATTAGLGKSRMQHKKSIRVVAEDRKRLLERSGASERRKVGAATDLARRRSTKLWGGRVIEVTPGTETAGAVSSDSPTSVTSAEGRPVFKWVKGDLIGKGTYGRVYLALNATTGEMIAVKQVELPTTDSDREDARQKGVVTALKSEIETLKDLDHPNIVSYLGFEETRANLSIFLEYVPGGSVGSCLRKHGKLDEATIKSFLQQILFGLNYLHGRGILHRDLKADNLLVDYDGIVKISDFGTVRKSEDIYGNVASMSMQGSIFWMAPEVVSLSRSGYSAKVDIWSLGCVVLEMFAGRRPWSDEEAVQAMFKIGAERRAPPIPPDVRLSKAAAHFLKTCFAVDPNERPTASRLLDHVFPHAEPGWAFNMSSLYRQLHR